MQPSLVDVFPGGRGRELGYMFLPKAWGHGYATEACAAALDWLAGVRPDEPAIVVIPAANIGSMRVGAKLGFIEVEQFEEYGNERWFAVRSSSTSSG